MGRDWFIKIQCVYLHVCTLGCDVNVFLEADDRHKRLKVPNLIQPLASDEVTHCLKTSLSQRIVLTWTHYQVLLRSGLLEDRLNSKLTFFAT